MKENQVDSAQTLGRKVLKLVVDCIFPTQVIHVGDGLERCRILRMCEKRDVFFLITHPSKTDEPRTYPVVWSLKAFSDTKIIVPNASDQNTFMAKFLAEIAGIDLYPIVTADVKERSSSQYKQGYGNFAYFRRLIKTLGNREDPGIVFLAPSAGRRPLLQTPTTRAAEFLVTSGGSKRGRNFVIVCMGVEINGVSDYKKASGNNVGRKYTIRIGNAYTNEELLNQLEAYRELHNLPKLRMNRPYEHVDRWLFETQFPQLVPKPYLPYN